MVVLVVVAAAGGLALIGYLGLRRIGYWIDEQTETLRRGIATSYTQLEALYGLYAELGLAGRLPRTRDWAASPDLLCLLADWARSRTPKVVVECGSGVSTVVLARCLQLNGAGHVYSLDHDPRFAGETRRHLERLGLDAWATVIYAPLVRHHLHGEEWPWYATEALPDQPFDMLVIDGPPKDAGTLARYPAGPLLFRRLAGSALVVLDDADRDDERQILARWGREFPGLVQRSWSTEKGCAVLESAPPPAPPESGVVVQSEAPAGMVSLPGDPIIAPAPPAGGHPPTAR